MDDVGRLLAVSVNRRNAELVAKVLSERGHRVLIATSIDELDRLLDCTDELDVAVIDMAGFDSSLWRRCERMREREIAFLLVLNRDHPRARSAGLERGARVVLAKPLAVRELLGVVDGVLGT